jgi:hypothetical protein
MRFITEYLAVCDEVAWWVTDTQEKKTLCNCTSKEVAEMLCTLLNTHFVDRDEDATVALDPDVLAKIGIMIEVMMEWDVKSRIYLINEIEELNNK